MTESTDTKAETRTHSGTPSLDSLAGATPAMAQYIEIKTANPDCLLFFRMGDFYELFFQDAEEASRALGITLTKRGKHQGQDIPMCGVPVHAADDYLQRLIALGFRVAVCEQLEDPAQAKKRGSKAVVKRDVVRLVTPGTLTEDNLLDARQNNFLAALARRGAAEQDDYALAWVDMSTGQFKLASTKRAQLEADIARIDPSELLMADTLFSDPDLKEWMDGLRAALVPLPGGFFDSVGAEDRLTRFYEVASLDAFGTFERTEKMAAGAIVAYLEKTQVDDRPALNPPSREDSDATMLIDPATRANLELTRTLSGEKAGSLLATLDRTVTGAGSRLLTSRLASPSTSVQTVSDRYDAIDWFVGDGLLRGDTRRHLAQVPDMARSLTRLSMDRGGPRDMAAITSGLSAANEIASLLVAASNLPAEIAESIEAIKSAPFELAEKLSAALKDDLPLLKRDGGFVREGYLADLDETRSLRDQSRQIIVGLQSKYSELAEVKALKIKHNNVLGYFIEVPAQHGDKLMQAPLNETFIHRQTLANAMRFNTNELAELQSGITNAADRALGLELEVYEDLLTAILAEETPIKQVAEALAVLDVASANAELAETQRYCRPVIDESLAFDIKAGRHPVVERALAKSMSDPFVPNDCDLTGNSEGGGLIWLITGPNMAGKSTFMRQNALIAIMAQAGLFVPAESAHIGVVDRLYSRVGAADDLARGRSTFMVEMVETAAILNQAGERSLVILDEIGRGTATFDGLSIAWAAIEHLHEANKSRALFATHYHELTALSEKLPRLSNATVKVSEWNGEVVFLHEIAPGAADRSYGIQVAKLAGLPASVVARSQEVLTLLEANDRERPPSLVDELPLFSVTQKAAPPSAAVQQESAVDKALEDINPDELTPRDALEALYRLKTLAKD